MIKAIHKASHTDGQRSADVETLQLIIIVYLALLALLWASNSTFPLQLSDKCSILVYFQWEIW